MKHPSAIRVACAAFLAISALAACRSAVKTPAQLPGAEVREYQGENLSSVKDFRENSIKGPQQVSLDKYKLEVVGLVDKPLTLKYDQVLENPHYSKVITLYCVEGWDAKILWEGVLIDDLLSPAGVKEGAVTVIFHAADGYTSSLPLEYVRQNKIMLAFKMNDIALPTERGFPFQVVAESKWGYKWAKWVTRIELSADPNYRGYWEQRGYNNDGELEGPIFEE
jgi:DMSO/TMAO reductase YedYZ molybdopterin-dependent catalytic subunit